tara:strand:+ start:549 stop:1271 length:723 start_codon:yes stop_codon:yes gene_type:complete
MANLPQKIISVEKLKLLGSKNIGSILEIDKLTLKASTLTVVLGPNGAGKSLFLNLLQGLILPTEGKITFNNEIPIKPTYSKISIVTQKPRFLRKSVANNIKFILKLNNKYSHKNLLDVLERFGLSAQRELLANKLSGGEKQRLALALAICKDPSILLLDEPTASADPQTTLMIEKILSEESSLGKKLILVTHDIAQAKRLGQDIIFIYKGKIIEQKTVRSFFKNPEKKESIQFLSGEITL